MKPQSLEKFREFIDELEEEYGNLEGFEVRLHHPIVEGQRQEFANITEFVLHYIHSAKIDIPK